MAENKLVDLESIEYRNVIFWIYYATSDKSFHAGSEVGNVYDKYDAERGNNTMGFETPVKAIDAIKKHIDDVIDNIATSTYEELASKISELSFYDGEDYEVDASVLKLIIENFKLK